MYSYKDRIRAVELYSQRAANVMSLIQTAKINGLDPQAYLRDVLEPLPTTKYSEIDSLLPHNWSPGSSSLTGDTGAH